MRPRRLEWVAVVTVAVIAAAVMAWVVLRVAGRLR